MRANNGRRVAKAIDNYSGPLTYTVTFDHEAVKMENYIHMVIKKMKSYFYLQG